MERFLFFCNSVKSLRIIYLIHWLNLKCALTFLTIKLWKGQKVTYCDFYPSRNSDSFTNATNTDITDESPQIRPHTLQCISIVCNFFIIELNTVLGYDRYVLECCTPTLLSGTSWELSLPVSAWCIATRCKLSINLLIVSWLTLSMY